MSFQISDLKKLRSEIRTRIGSFLWQQKLAGQPLWKRVLVRSCQITVAVIRDLIQGQLSLRAMSLVFTTVIGFFPLLALSFAVLKSLGVHNAMEPTLLTVLQPLGERSAELTGEILGYVDNLQVELIGITSVGLLLYIVLDMMRKIESSFNFIWAVKKGRSWSSRVSEYLFAVIVSPLLLFLSISITSYVNTNFFERFLENLSYGGIIIGATAVLAPVLLMSLAFAFAYSFLPNTRVKFSSAFIGGLVTTIIWKLMGSVFQGFFVSSARESIYLAFATAIAVLFFVYIGWLVALVGSSIAFYHQYPAKTRSGRDKLVMSISQQEQLSLAVASLIIKRFAQGGDPLTEEELAASLHSSPVIVGQSLDVLLSIGLISQTADDPVRFLPTHSIDDCTLVDIWRALRNYNTDQLIDHSDSHELELIKEFQTSMDKLVEEQFGSKKFIDLPD